MNKHFVFDGVEHPYIDAKNSHRTERRVELPLGWAFCMRHDDKDLLEVGNVMRAYWGDRFHHRVIDLYEKRPGWERYHNEDVLTWEPARRPGAVLSVSTLEHTPDPVTAINRVLSWSDNVLITVPFGYNSPVPQEVGRLNTTDLALMSWPCDSVRWLERVSDRNEWVDRGVVRGPADFPGYDDVQHHANGVLVLLKGVTH